jgi:hypothetical protein
VNELYRHASPCLPSDTSEKQLVAAQALFLEVEEDQQQQQ